MKNQISSVEHFHKTFGAPISNRPVANIPLGRKNLRYELMKEENEEYLLATSNNDIVEIADALGDMLYILCGTIIEHGLQHKIEEVFDEIQRSNMSKLDANGKPIYREDGKVLKGPGYFKPNISKILEGQTILNKPDNKRLVSIAALSENGVIAKDGRIPWHLPEDFRHFKDVTNGSFIIMGRKTFESLPFVLPNRTHVVISRSATRETLKIDPELRNQVIIVRSLQEAIFVLPNRTTSYIIGGGEVYQQAMEIVDELDLTIIATTIIGDNLTMFPSAMQYMGQFEVVSREDKGDVKSGLHFSFIKLVRK